MRADQAAEYQRIIVIIGSPRLCFKVACIPSLPCEYSFLDTENEQSTGLEDRLRAQGETDMLPGEQSKPNNKTKNELI